MKQFDTRIQYKYDKYENWVNNGHKINSLAGEMYVYKMPDESTRIKFGDGSNLVSNLPYANIGDNYNTVLINASSPKYIVYYDDPELPADHDSLAQQKITYVLDMIDATKAEVVITTSAGESIYSAQITDSGAYDVEKLHPSTTYYVTATVYYSDATTPVVEKLQVKTGYLTIDDSEDNYCLVCDEEDVTLHKGRHKPYDGKKWSCVLKANTITLRNLEDEPKSDAGKYATTLSLPEGCVWKSDKTTEAKTVDWGIQKANEYGGAISFRDDQGATLNTIYVPDDSPDHPTNYSQTIYVVPVFGNREYEIKSSIQLDVIKYDIRVEYYDDEDANTHPTEITRKSPDTIIIQFGENSPKSVIMNVKGSTNITEWNYTLRTTTNMLAEYSWSNIYDIAQKGEAAERYLEVGQTKPVKLNGQIQDAEFNNSEEFSVKLVHIETVFTDSGLKYNKLYFQCFTGPNNEDVCIRGVFEAYFDTGILYELTEVQELLRDTPQLLDVILPTTESYANAYFENQTLYVESVSVTSKFHIPTQDQVERIFEYSSSLSDQRIRYAHDAIRDAGQCWWITNDFYYDETTGSLGSGAYDVLGNSSNTINGRAEGISYFGLSPIFVIGEPPKS